MPPSPAAQPTAFPTAGGGALRDLLSEGVSPWLEGVHRLLMTSGAFALLIADSGVRGATFDPAVLAEAVASDAGYRQQLAGLARPTPVDVAVRAISVDDARRACDELRGVHSETGGGDGQVSIGLEPELAHDAPGTVAGAVVLAQAVNRPNLLVEIAATADGLTAAADCLALGIGVHITGVFTVDRFRAAARAHLEGLERALANGRTPAGIASVASLPVGRLDCAVDALLGRLDSERARALRGAAALASARLLYRCQDEVLGSERWRALRNAGARPQRLMWTAGGAPRPVHPPGCHAERLVAWGTVSTMPLATLESVDRNGRLEGDTLSGEHEAAQAVLDELGCLGISLDAVARSLEQESASRQRRSWRELRAAVGALLGAD
jgi:transaldolase